MLGACIDSVGAQVWCKKQYSCGCDTPQPCVQCSPLASPPAISGWQGSLSTVSMPCWACTRTTNKHNDYPQRSSASGHGHCDMAHVHGWSGEHLLRHLQLPWEWDVQLFLRGHKGITNLASSLAVQTLPCPLYGSCNIPPSVSSGLIKCSSHSCAHAPM